jgi:brefeldin A-inhibited guanine nucleotide-exchange protein
MRDLAGNAEDQMKAAETSNAVFFRAHQVDQARPMFKVSWQALLASLTRPLQESEDEFVISLCLEGLRDCIHIACVFDMEESKTFIQSLAKFTNL